MTRAVVILFVLNFVVFSWIRASVYDPRQLPEKGGYIWQQSKYLFPYNVFTNGSWHEEWR